jgi:hypothetical protein
MHFEYPLIKHIKFIIFFVFAISRLLLGLLALETKWTINTKDGDIGLLVAIYP